MNDHTLGIARRRNEAARRRKVRQGRRERPAGREEVHLLERA